ncbi:MAG: cyclic pyranopterin monophosphate synthase MoaC [Lachnospiraceae bacterium]|nr:cyclic pyranopterin monophosphate synthase MoaC [Lachnospiraceae bacterium]
MEELTHFDAAGNARMVDVGDKPQSERTAVAQGRVRLNAETFALIKDGKMKKGDVLSVAQIAGIMGAKKTPDLIPLCHPIQLNRIDLTLTPEEETHSIVIRAEAGCMGQTGVEMEVLSAVSVAALTVYDMCKAVQKDIEIGEIRLLSKTGGVHGDYEWDSRQQS